MLDIFIGRPPTQNKMEEEPSPIQKTVRELLRVARNLQFDRRKSTRDRRRNRDEDFVVNLSHRPERRRRIDRRQNNSLTDANFRLKERRKNRHDRRKSVNEGVHVRLSTRKERRSGFDRRGNKPL